MPEPSTFVLLWIAAAAILLHALIAAIPILGVFGMNATAVISGRRFAVLRGTGGEHFWYPIACTMGALANVSFIVGYVSFWRKSVGLARWSSTLGTCLSLSVILPLALSKELNGVYLGYGLWAASLLALALGSRRAAIDT